MTPTPAIDALTELLADDELSSMILDLLTYDRFELRSPELRAELAPTDAMMPFLLDSLNALH